MDEKYELIEHIYKDAYMAVYTLNKLLKNLENKDNKIKGTIEDILKKYEDFLSKTKDELTANDLPLEGESTITKLMSSMGIYKEVKNDNSDSSIADMLIKGISMGSIDMEKKIKDYSKEVNKDHLNLAKDFMKFQEKTIEDLKKFL